MPDIAETYNYHLVEKHAAWTAAGPVVSRLPNPEIDALEGRATATVAEPSTLALFGFATGTWTTGVVFGGFVGAGAAVALAPLLILFAGVAQFIGGLYAYRRGNALGANAFCCYGAYSAVVGVTVLAGLLGPGHAGAGASMMLAWFNLSFAFISLALAVAALRRNLVLTALFAALVGGYTLIGVSLLNLDPTGAVMLHGVAAAGAALLFVAALLAFYLGAAMVVNSTWQRTILPVLGEP